MSVAAVRDLRQARAPAGPEDLAALESDVFAGLVLARAAAGAGRCHDHLGRGQSRADPGLVRAPVVGDGAR